MDDAVLTFLTDEVTDVIAQTGIRHLILKVAYRLDKKPLAFREMYRQGIKKARQHRIATIPVARDRRDIKSDFAGLYGNRVHGSSTWTRLLEMVERQRKQRA